jgi:hypothetical protein
MIVPLAAGVIGGQPTAGLLVGVGGFVVAGTDTGATYRTRATTMIAAALGVTTAYFLGALTAAPRWLSVLLFVGVLVGSALIGTVGPRVALVSTMITVAFITGAFLPSSLAADARAALALLAGGEPGSSALAIAGDVSTAAGQVLDSIIALKQVLDQAGPGQLAGPAVAIIGEAGDALLCMRAALVGRSRRLPYPSSPAPVTRRARPIG